MAEARLSPVEALALIEIDGIACAMRAHDAALKRAPIRVLANAPVSPGKVLLLFGGDVAATEEALAAVDGIVGSRRLDRLYLPGVDPQVVAALGGERTARRGAALGVAEARSAAATLEAADIAVKVADVALGRLHVAAGFGGRGFFTLVGSHSDLEAAQEALVDRLGERLLDYEIIAAPHEELEDAAFLRPWRLDPAG